MANTRDSFAAEPKRGTALHLKARPPAVPSGLAGAAAEASTSAQPPSVLPRSSEPGRHTNELRSRVTDAALFAALPVPALLADSDLRIVGANAAAIDLLGSRAVLANRCLEGWFAPTGGASGRRPVHGVEHVTIEGAAGQRVDVEVQRVALNLPGREGDSLVILHDVTHRVEMSRLRESLIHDAAHEFRTPLMTLDSAVDILQRDRRQLTEAEIDHLLQAAHRAAGRLVGLSRAMLDAGAIQAGRLTIHAEPTALRPLIDRAIEAVAGDLEAREQRVAFDLARNAGAVLADPVLICQVLTNLLTNASKFGPPRGTIHVRARLAGATVRVSVRDTGPGIPRRQQGRIFERFYRARADGAPGVGIGLAIARGIVVGHGGEIGLQSTPGKGTRVWFTLPNATAGERARAAPVEERCAY